MNPNKFSYNDAECAPSRAMQVSDQLDTLCRALDELHTVAESLAGRLQPVMRPVCKENDVLSNEGATESSPLAQELRARVNSVCSVRDKLCQIMNHLDL